MARTRVPGGYSEPETMVPDVSGMLVEAILEDQGRREGT